jgi:hypothetical protein
MLPFAEPISQAWCVQSACYSPGRCQRMNALHRYDKTYDLWRALVTAQATGSWHTPGTLAASQRPHPLPPIACLRTLICG